MYVGACSELMLRSRNILLLDTVSTEESASWFMVVYRFDYRRAVPLWH